MATARSPWGCRVGGGWVLVGGGEAAGGMSEFTPGSVAAVSINSGPVALGDRTLPSSNAPPPAAAMSTTTSAAINHCASTRSPVAACRWPGVGVPLSMGDGRGPGRGQLRSCRGRGRRGGQDQNGCPGEWVPARRAASWSPRELRAPTPPRSPTAGRGSGHPRRDDIVHRCGNAVFYL